MPNSAQAPGQPSWAELALFLFLHSIASGTSSVASGTSSAASGTPIQNSIEIAENQPKLLCNICRSSQAENEMILETLIRWKMTSIEDDLSRR